MPKRLTTDYVRSTLARESYVLLNNYCNYYSILFVRCPEGHEYITTFASWKSGVRCPICTKRIKWTYADVKRAFEKEGYTLLTTTYKNNKQRLYFICPNGHYGNILWSNWQKGHRCFKCGRLKAADKQRKSIEYIEKEFRKEGYILLTKEYINRNSKLKFRCPNGHIYYTTWREWVNGKRCAICAGNAKPSYEYVKESFMREGYELLSEVYINSSTKLKYKCPNGHMAYITWDKWRQGRRCPICNKISKFGSGNPMWRGGVSFEPYCDLWRNSEFKEFIKWRDGYICNNAGCYNIDDLVIHHIDYNKKNCDVSNLITLCRSCNSKVNKHRQWYVEWFRRLLYIRYNFNYE